MDEAGAAVKPDHHNAASSSGVALFGTWRVTSALVMTEGRERGKPQPKTGYLIFTTEPRIVALVAEPGRVPATNDTEALALARSMVAYTGTIELTPDQYTITLEFSSTMLSLDQKQIRFYRIDGDDLTITMPFHDSTVTPGVRTSTVLTAVRVREGGIPTVADSGPQPDGVRVRGN